MTVPYDPHAEWAEDDAKEPTQCVCGELAECPAETHVHGPQARWVAQPTRLSYVL